LPLLPVFGKVKTGPCPFCAEQRKDGNPVQHHHAQVVLTAEEKKAKRTSVQECPPESQLMPIDLLTEENICDWIFNAVSALYGVNYHKCEEVCWKHLPKLRERIPNLKTSCRFGAPWPLCFSTGYANGEFNLQRLSHMQNGYCPRLLAALRINHDCRSLWGTNVAVQALVHYCTGYATKGRKTLLNKMPQLKVRIEKFREKLRCGYYTDKSPLARATGLLSSIVFGIQGQIEVSLLTIVNSLLGKSEVMHPDKFAPMVMWPLLEFAEESDDKRGYRLDWQELFGLRHGGTIILTPGGQAQHGLLVDYQFRPPEFKNMSVYEYVQCVVKVPRKAAALKDDDRDDHIRYPLHPQHPHYQSHCARLLHYRDLVIPMFTGPLIASRKPSDVIGSHLLMSRADIS
jgi:hypothetical protein